MPNKNPRCRMIAVPREFMPLLEAELEKKGYFSYPQLMNEILLAHYNENGRKIKPAAAYANVKKLSRTR